MARSVSTNEYRVDFVEKTAEEVGDGTVYPMLVTLDQIAEIFYRVKDCIFIQGELTVSTIPPFPFGYKITASSTNPSNRATSVDYEGLIRGYTTLREEGLAVIPASHEPYLQAAYDAGGGILYSDVSDNEMALWLQGEINVKLPYWNTDGPSHTNAFSHYCQTYSTTSTDYFQGAQGDVLVSPAFIDCNISIVFFGDVAVVKSDPSNDIFAPTNLFYLGAVLDFQIAGGAVLINSQSGAISGTPVSPCNYVIRLSGSGENDISCPLYTDSTGYGVVSGLDFIHKATEWWPYAKNSPAEPIWNTETGVKL